MPADFEISPVIPPVQPQPTPGNTPTPAPSAPVSPGMPKQKNTQRILKWFILVAAGLFVVTVGSLWWGGNSFSDKDVVLAIDGPDRATSGDEVTYTVKWRNDTRVPLSEMSFRIFYPEGSIVLKDGQPTTPESEGFEVDALNPGESGEREIKLFLVGDKGAIKNLKVHLIFKAGTLRSAFEKETTVSTTITDLPVTLALVAPPSAVPGQPVQYILDARNDSGADITDLKVVFKYPDGFVVQQMRPQPDTGNTEWLLDTLRSGQATRITVTGVLSGNERETKTVEAVLQQKLNGQYVDYVRTEAFTMLSSPLLSVRVTTSEGREYVSFAGDTLRYTVTYGNTSQFTLSGLDLSIKLEGDMYDFSRIRADQGFFDDDTQTLRYDSSGVSEFSSLRPGQTGSVFFTIPLKAGFAGQMDGAKTFFVKATARLSTSNVPSGVDGDEVFSLDSLITKISTQPNLSQAILYDDGAGSGPLPPVVGQKTFFTVRWQLTNPGNDVRDAKVTATLPPGVTFEDVVFATNGTPPVFNRTSNTVTWNVGTLPFGTGNGTSRYEARFKISITPSSNQQGTTPALVAGATLTGTDSFTGQTVQMRLNDYTTASVENHSDDGRVQ